MNAPWMQTATGVAFDLIEPDPRKVRFVVDVAPALARTPRFGGHVSSGPYSVAQHSVIGAEVLLEETGNANLAAHFLLHDAHEAYLGDITRPVEGAIAHAVAGLLLGVVDPVTAVEHAIAGVKHRIDCAIFVAAGIGHPTPAVADQVKAMDARMLETERRHLLSQCERHWDAGPVRPIRIRGALKPWPWTIACERWVGLYRKLCPRGSL